ncbi:hypothetical protein B6D29_00085 [Microgenomates bacterium UTCPR1]|nr:MAG: hypothetical protein B6D29_00085 [Microgenomates bacterium UTCPR1]
MEEQPQKISLVNKRKGRRRTIHLITTTTKKSFKSASANCKQWVKKFGFPFVFRVSYEISQIGHKVSINSMDCNNTSDFNWGLEAFVKEYVT